MRLCLVFNAVTYGQESDMPLLFWCIPLIVFTSVWETYFGDERNSTRMMQPKAEKSAPPGNSRRPKQVPLWARRGLAVIARRAEP
jgi:hypothetical protein